jgi:hypothetical protein
MTRMTSPQKILYAGYEDYATGQTPSNDPTNFSYYVDAGNPDSESSYVELYWTYTQGTYKATNFILWMSDGTAYAQKAVDALPGTSISYRVLIGRLHKSKPFTVQIWAEFIYANGVMKKAAVAGWNFTPSADYGTQQTGVAVSAAVDWAGGNVWFDTDQYRNNLAPTNYPGIATLALTATSTGAYKVAWNITYSQGANIATDFAVYVKYGGGTIALTDPHFEISANVTTFELPGIQIAPATKYSFGVAALAKTRNGTSFNSTIATLIDQTGLDSVVYLGNGNTHGVQVVDAGGVMYLDSVSWLENLMSVKTGGILDFYTAGVGVFKPRVVISSASPPVAPTMTAHEMIIFLASHASYQNAFVVYYDGTDRYYIGLHWTDNTFKGGKNLY